MHEYFNSADATVALRLLLAAVAGALIGLEREVHGRPAGLRTHLLVAVASCLMMMLSEGFYLKYGDLPGTSVVRLDPSRVAAQIIAGIGFLGAGVILKEGLSVRGLTTAACLWMAAGLGMGFGMGAYFLSLLTTAIGLFSLIFLKKIEPFLKKDRYLYVDVIADGKVDIYSELENVFVAHGMRVSDVSSDHDLIAEEIHYGFILTQHRRRMGRELAASIATVAGVKRISYR